MVFVKVMASKKKYTNMRELVRTAKNRGNKLPLVLKRCVASVSDKIEKGKLKPKRGYDKYSASLSICIASFQEHGLLGKGELTMTSKGKKRSSEYKEKPDTIDKIAKFSVLASQWKETKEKQQKAADKKNREKEKRFKGMVGEGVLTEDAKLRWLWMQLPKKLRRRVGRRRFGKFVTALDNNVVIDKAATSARIAVPLAINISRALNSLGLM